MSDNKPTENEELDPNTPWSPDELNANKGMTPAELQALSSQLPVVQEIIDWFDEQIAGFLNPNCIKDATIKSSAEDIKNAVLFAQLNSKSYSSKRQEFADRFKQYLEPPKEPPEQE